MTINVTPKTAMQRITEKTNNEVADATDEMSKWFYEEKKLLREHPNLRKELGTSVLWEYEIYMEERRQNWY